MFLAMLLTFSAVFALGHSIVAAQTQTDGQMPLKNCHERFQQIAGGDKTIAPQEWKEAQWGQGTMKGVGPSPGAAVEFGGVDTNKDGFITEDEFCAWAGK